MDFGGMADKAKEWAGKNPEKADSFVEKGEDAVNQRFAGHDEQVDKLGDRAKNYLHPEQDGETPPPPPPGEAPPPPQG